MKKIIKSFQPYSRGFLWALLFALFIVLLSYLTQITLQQWKKQVIKSNMVLCDLMAEQLAEAALPLVSRSLSQPLNEDTLVRHLDSILTVLTNQKLQRAAGLEGGFFWVRRAKFIGYGYPTSPPPKPVYGPPPRSFNFIKGQIQNTINSGQIITRLHQFDPAIFPLTTRPIFLQQQLVAVTWVRTHIERELPKIKIRQILSIAFFFAFLGFLIAGIGSLRVRRKIRNLNTDLRGIEAGEVEQIRPLTGNLSFVATEVNRMVKALKNEHIKRQELERELSNKARLAALGRLLAGVAHEIKTPLAILKTRIQMWQHDIRNLDTRDLPASLNQESMQMVVDEADRLDGLIKKLLYLSRPVKRHLRSTDVNELIRHTIDVLETGKRGRPGQIALHPNSLLPPAPMDSAAMEQVLINVLTNALEAGPQTSPVSVKTTASDGFLQIEIADLGSGISQDNKQHIFDPFFSTKENGFGLGLSIAYEIVTAHQGKIEFFANQPQGTICIISIPIAQEVPQTDV